MSQFLHTFKASGISPISSAMVSSTHSAHSHNHNATPCIGRRNQSACLNATSARHSMHSTSSHGTNSSNSNSAHSGSSSHHQRQQQLQHGGAGGMTMMCERDDSLGDSTDRLDESGFCSQINIADMVLNGVPDHEIVAHFLRELRLHDDYLALLLQSGYDMQTLLKVSPEDLTAVGVSKPGHRKRLINELHALHAHGVNEDKWPVAVERGAQGLREWLRALNLTDYTRLFEAQGYTDVWRDIVPLTWEDLEDVGVKRLGHLKKLGLAIRKLKENRHKRAAQAQPAPSESATPQHVQQPWTEASQPMATYNTDSLNRRLCITTQAVIHEEQPGTSAAAPQAPAPAASVAVPAATSSSTPHLQYARLRPTDAGGSGAAQSGPKVPVASSLHASAACAGSLVRMQLHSPSRVLLQQKQASSEAKCAPPSGYCVQPLSPRNGPKATGAGVHSDSDDGSDGAPLPPPLELHCERSIEQLRYMRLSSQSDQQQQHCTDGAPPTPSKQRAGRAPHPRPADMGDMLAHFTHQLDAMLGDNAAAAVAGRPAGGIQQSEV